MISATNSLYPSPSTFSNQLSNLNTISKQSSPGRSSLSSSPLSMLTIPTTRTTIQIPIQPPYPPQIHMRTVQMPFDPIGTQQILNVASPLQHYDDRFRDSLQNDHHNPSIQVLAINLYNLRKNKYRFYVSQMEYFHKIHTAVHRRIDLHQQYHHFK